MRFDIYSGDMKKFYSEQPGASAGRAVAKFYESEGHECRLFEARQDRPGGLIDELVIYDGSEGYPMSRKVAKEIGGDESSSVAVIPAKTERLLHGLAESFKLNISWQEVNRDG